MKIKRPANERGHVKWNWLDAYHTFSFGSYFDPKWMGFSKLRVINDDYIGAGMGFDTHPHNNMEIVSFIMEGGLEHRDTMGNHAVIEPGEIQVMSAGTGVQHSEHNPFKDKQTHSLQIWIEPKLLDIPPSYQQYTYPKKNNELVLLVSPNNKEVATINQDVEIYLGKYTNTSAKLELDKNAKYWIHLFEGELNFEADSYRAGDGLGLIEEASLQLEVLGTAQFLLFKLP